MRKLLSRVQVENTISSMWEGFGLIPENHPNKELSREKILKEEKRLKEELQLQQEICQLAIDSCYLINSANPLAVAQSILSMHDACKHAVENGYLSPTKSMDAYHKAHEKKLAPETVVA